MVCTFLTCRVLLDLLLGFVHVACVAILAMDVEVDVTDVTASTAFRPWRFCGGTRALG